MANMQRCNAQLALIRLAARQIEDQRARNEVEQARFQLFAALDLGKDDVALKWLRALRMASKAIPDWADADVAEALDEIEAEVSRGVTVPATGA